MLEQKLLLCVILKLCLSLISSRVIFDTSDKVIVTYRLSNESVPVNYFIYLETDIHTGTNFIYTGYVIIDIKILDDTNLLRLHQRQITVNTVELTDSNDNKLSVLDFQSIVDYDFLDIELANILKASNEIYKLKITFTAPLREIAQGFYRSYYIDDDAEEHWLAATQFEPTNARYAFPCYDEPGLKSTFELQIKHHSNYTAISNYDGIRIENNDDEYVITKFHKTINMSSYLLAFIVSDYKSKNNLFVTPKQSVYTRPNAINQTKLALEEGVKIIKVLEQYVGIPYSLDKLDQASIPDFQPGAMENWGLVTYKEELLLFNEENGTLKQKLDVITTIAHEYGHQFFGNLVSPKWWEYIWLNEGFATLMEYYLPHLLYPTERYMDLFVINRLQYALTVDGLKTTRPMTHYAESPSGISGLFDTIAYHKSGSVLRMVQHFLTDEVFKNGLKLYLETNLFDVTVPTDLFTALAKVNKDDLIATIGYDLNEILESWTLQQGYPLLTVTRNQEKRTISISQQQFLYKNGDEISDQLWIIPFTYYTTTSDTVEQTRPINWMPKQTEIDLDLSLKESEWIIFNTDQSGYYRVNYDESNWKLITNYISQETDAFEKISPINRAQLIDDSFNLARAGIIPYEIPLNMVQYLAVEFDYIPWAAANNNFGYLRSLLLKSNVNKYWSLFLNELTNSTMEKIGYKQKEDESNFDILLRSLIVELSCKIGNSVCVDFMTSARNNYFNTQVIDRNLKEQILCFGLDQTSYNEILARVLLNADAAKDQAEQALFLNALGCVENKILLQVSLLITIIEPINLRSADRNRIFTSVLSKTEYGFEVAIDFVSTNYEEIQRLYSGNKTLNSMVVSIASYVRTESEAASFETDLLYPLRNLIDESSIESSKNIISERLLWQVEYEETIKNFLWKYYDVKEEEEEEEEQKNDDDDGASTRLISIGLLLILQFIIQMYNF